jgi:hypothetical protein
VGQVNLSPLRASIHNSYTCASFSTVCSWRTCSSMRRSKSLSRLISSSDKFVNMISCPRMEMGNMALCISAPAWVRYIGRDPRGPSVKSTKPRADSMLTLFEMTALLSTRKSDTSLADAPGRMAKAEITRQSLVPSRKCRRISCDSRQTRTLDSREISLGVKFSGSIPSASGSVTASGGVDDRGPCNTSLNMTLLLMAGERDTLVDLLLSFMEAPSPHYLRLGLQKPRPWGGVANSLSMELGPLALHGGLAQTPEEEPACFTAPVHPWSRWASSMG